MLREIDKVIGIVIVAHGALAKEYLAAVEHVVGPLDAAQAIAIAPDDDRAVKQGEICTAADNVDRGAGVVIVVDMFGGSPSNLSLKACAQAGNRRIIYGANLPLFVKLAKSRHLALSNAVERACEAGRKYLNCCDPPSN